MERGEKVVGRNKKVWRTEALRQYNGQERIFKTVDRRREGMEKSRVVMAGGTRSGEVKKVVRRKKKSRVRRYEGWK